MNPYDQDIGGLAALAVHVWGLQLVNLPDESVSVGSDRLDKRTIDNRANLSIIDNRLSIIIIIELGGEGPSRIYPSYSLF